MPEDTETGSHLTLTDTERSTLENSSFILTKNKIISKAQSLLVRTRDHLSGYLDQAQAALPGHVSWQNCKVSKGENYHGLPYLVLDCPQDFDKTNIFTFRTMMWWGHEFSTTLHLQGDYLDLYRRKLLDAYDRGGMKDVYICRHETPWEYHFEESNYLPAEKSPEVFNEMVTKSSFVKLSRKWPLEDWKKIPFLSLETWKLFEQEIFS